MVGQGDGSFVVGQGDGSFVPDYPRLSRIIPDSGTKEPSQCHLDKVP